LIENWLLKIGLPKPDKWFPEQERSLRELSSNLQLGKTACGVGNGGRQAHQRRVWSARSMDDNSILDKFQ